MRECPKEAMRMVKGPEQKLCEEQLRALALLSLEQRRLRAELSAVPTAPCGDEGQALSSALLWGDSDRAQGMAWSCLGQA